jgi:diguanylate cyclase (GGDEF)-like protein
MGLKMETEYSLRIGDYDRWFACTISPLQADTVLWVAHDITNRIQAEKVQEVIYEISQAAISTESIDELYVSIHTILAELIHVENFFIALYDPSTSLISFPYYVDQYDDPPPANKPGRGLTEYVMRTMQPLLAPRPVFDELILRGEIESVGTVSVDWLGVPLMVEGQVIGVMVTQSYQENIHFNQEDMRLFEFVSTQVAQMIDRKRVEEKIRYLGIHDSLTSLYNRAYFDEEMKRLDNGRQFPVSVLMADIDDLKGINDQEGHAAGDECLRLAAQSLKAAFRTEDVVARIGGDEFAALLPGIDARMAAKAKLRIIDNIKKQNATREGKLLEISMGVSTAKEIGSLVEALRLADDQMYMEKQSKEVAAHK